MAKKNFISKLFLKLRRINANHLFNLSMGIRHFLKKELLKFSSNFMLNSQKAMQLYGN